MLGVVSEQTPKGGALTLNAISGIGMLAVGTLGFPYIGALQADMQIAAISTNQEITAKVSGLGADGNFTASKSIYEVIKYDAVDNDLMAARLKESLPDEADRNATKADIDKVLGASNQGALANMIIFPVIMLVAYIVLIMHFKGKGGYKPVELSAGADSGGDSSDSSDDSGEES